jgi:hypothetical protein
MYPATSVLVSIARGGGGGGIKNWALAITRASCSTKVHTRESEMVRTILPCTCQVKLFFRGGDRGSVCLV